MKGQVAQETVPGAGAQEQVHVHVSPLQWRQEKKPWAQGPTGQLQSSQQLQAATGWGLAGIGHGKVGTDHEHATPSADGKQAHGQGFNLVAVPGRQFIPGTAGNVALASTPSTNPFEEIPANLHNTATGDMRCSPTAFRDATSEDPSQPRHKINTWIQNSARHTTGSKRYGMQEGEAHITL